MDILEMTIGELDVAVRDGVVTKGQVIEAIWLRYGWEVTEWLAARITPLGG